MRSSRVLNVLSCMLMSLSLWAAPPSAEKVAAAPATANAPVPPTQALPAPELIPAIALSHRAKRLQKAFESGDPQAIQVAVQEVELLRRGYATIDVMPLVDAMALWARELGKKGNPDLGLQVISTVERWTPGHPSLLGTRIALMRQQGIRGYIWSLPDVIKLNQLRMTHPTNRWLWIVHHAGWLRVMAAMLLWSWTLCLTMRYRRVFRHLWEEGHLRRSFSPLVLALLGGLAITLPVVAGLDPSIMAMCWLWLLAPFLNGKEVRAVVFILVLQLVHPLLAVFEPQASHEPPPSIVALQLQPQVRVADAQALKFLPELDREFLKGWQQLQRQDWVAAETTFRGLLGHHPDQAEVLNNLGVALYQQNKHEDASKEFDNAFKVNPKSIEILVNQSVLAFEHLDTVLGIGKQEEARQVDAVAYERLEAVNQSKKDQRTFASPLPDTPVRIRALMDAYKSPTPTEWTEHIKDKGVALNFILPILAAALFLLRLRQSIQQAHASQCTRCGEPFRTTDSDDSQVCSKCHHLFTLKDGLHAESRRRKLDEVAQFQTSQRRIHRTLIVLLPGADQAFVGETREGFLELIFFCFAFGLTLTTSQTVRYPGEILPDPVSTWLPVGILLLTILFLRSWIKLLPRKA